MFEFLMLCVVAGFCCAVWEMYDVKKNPEKYDSYSDDRFETGYGRSRRDMFDNFR